MLIRGESGVGKELVARAIHFKSARHSRPFCTMNCAALAEITARKRALRPRKGIIYRRDGTQNRQVRTSAPRDALPRRSRGNEPRHSGQVSSRARRPPVRARWRAEPGQVDVRVVAATNRNLEREVERGTFRKDLYFRLHVVELMVTPLRKRRTDIPILAEYFLASSSRKTGRQVGSFSRGALDAMNAYDWPGNVRELQNVIERAVILCPGDQVREEDIRLTALRTPPSDPTIGVMDQGRSIAKSL